MIEYNIGTQYVYIAVSGCRSLLQSPVVNFFALGVVENSKFAVEIVILSVTVPESISGIGGHIAISGCRSSPQSPEVIFSLLGVVENPKFAVGIAVISVILSDI